MVSRPHPLDPLTADEIAAAAAIVRRERELDDRTAFVSISLREPAKEDVLAGARIEREADIVLLDPAAESSFEVVVSLDRSALVDWRELRGLQPAMTPEEYELVERVVKAHPDFRAALARRGIGEEQLELVGVDPVPVGSWGDHQYEGRRLIRALSWIAPYPGGNTYARPIEGLVGLVDTHRAEVVSVDDHGAVAIPPGTGEYRAGRAGPLRDEVAPLEITQPEGPGFTLEGNLVRWERWQLRVGFTTREGLVLHQVGYEDDGRLRPVLYRASFSEMAVPYGDPSPTRYIHSPFDIGENLVGRLANSLELGCDCLGEIRYLDGAVCDSRGEPVVIRNAVCLHEEDAGVLWKHWDFRTGHTEVRRSRRLVVSSISTIGNYDYGFFWHFYQDGSIEVLVKATGILATAASPPGERPEHGQLVAEGLNGMIHQHFFNVRLDLDVDGRAERRLRGRDGGVPRRPRQPVRQRVPARAPPAAHRERVAPGRRPAPWTLLARRQQRAAQRRRRRGRLEALPGGERAAVRPARLRAAAPGGLRHEARLGHALRRGESATRPATTPTSTRAAPACRPTSRRIGRSRTRTSCSGTRSASTTCRDRRTGR